MQNVADQNIWRAYLRRLVAAAFLLFLLVEWGSHGLAFAHSASAAKDRAAYSEEDGHDDPCKTMIRCSDGRRQDQKTPNLGHDKSQYNAFLRHMPDPFDRNAGLNRTRLPREKVYALTRPISPPFHPPELS